MQRVILFAALSAALSIVPLVLLARQGSAEGVGCPNVHAHEPLVMHDQSGYTFAGQLIARHLSVYSSGFAMLSDATDFQPPRAAAKFVEPQQAFALLRDLHDLGAFAACDDETVLFDSPIHTLTVLRGKPQSLANTFSWHPVTGAYEAIEQRLDDFVATHFPDF